MEDDNNWHYRFKHRRTRQNQNFTKSIKYIEILFQGVNKTFNKK